MWIKKQYAVLGLLFCLFLAPFLLALWYYGRVDLHQQSLTNQGHLLNKTIQISEWHHLKTWRLVYVTPKPCDDACLQTLMTLARIRLALGRHLYGLELWLIAPQPMSAHVELIQQLKDIDVHVAVFDPMPHALSEAPIWLLNRNGEGVLTYQDVLHPQAIFSDLKRLSSLWEK